MRLQSIIRAQEETAVAGEGEGGDQVTIGLCFKYDWLKRQAQIFWTNQKTK